MIPEGPDQIKQAIAALAQRCRWSDPITSKIERDLTSWFEAEWCVEAILVALGRKPDNTWQAPQGNREDLGQYLRDRLAAWYDDGPNADSATARLAPPRQGQSLRQWWWINRQNHKQSQARVNQQVASERARRARAAAIEASRSKVTVWDRIARARAADARRRDALDSLGSSQSSGLTGSELDQTLRVVHASPRSKLTATHAGRRAVIINDPRVQALVDRFMLTRRISTAEQQVLINAMKTARLVGATAQLEAWGPGGEVLSSDGRRILAYLDSAIDENMSFDSLVALITTAVEQPDTLW